MKHAIVILMGIMLSCTAIASELRPGQIVYADVIDRVDSETGRTSYVSAVGEIKKVFGETAEVRWRRVNGTVNRSSSVVDCDSLSKKTNCSGGICIGNDVHHVWQELVVTSAGNLVHVPRDLIGEVRNVFENGTAEILWETSDGRPVNWPYYYLLVEELTKQTDTCQNCQ